MTQRDESEGEMPLKWVRDPDNAAFCDSRVSGDGLLEGTRGEAVRGDIDDVVAAGHDVDVPVCVDHARVAGVEPAAVEAREVALVEALWVVEEGGEACGGEGEVEHDVAHVAVGELGAVIVDDAHVEAGHGFAGCARLCGEGSGLVGVVVVAERGAGRVEILAARGVEGESGDGRAGFGGPPVIDDLSTWGAVGLKKVLVHADNGGFATFTCQKERPKVSQSIVTAILGEQLVLWIVTADGTKSCGGSEEDVDMVFG